MDLLQTKILTSYILHVRNQEFFRAGEVSWNQDTSINNHLQHEKKDFTGKNLRFFLLEAFKNCTYNWPQLGHFFPKLGHFFPISKKGRVDLPSPFSSYAPDLFKQYM